MSLILTAHELQTVQEILADKVPGVAVLAFGSRVSGKAKRWSDLDLMLRPRSALSLATLFDLQSAFMESDLQIRVEVCDANRVSEEFLSIALPTSVEIQAAG